MLEKRTSETEQKKWIFKR